MNKDRFGFKPIPICLGLACLLFAIWLQLTKVPAIHSWVNQFNNIAYDIQLRAMHNTARIDPQLPISIVEIDDKSLKEQGRWPWSRNKMADLLNKLFEMGATVVAFDSIFPEPEQNIVDALIKQPGLPPAVVQSLIMIKQQFDYDRQFASSLAKGDSVLGIAFHADAQAAQGILPAPIITLSPEESKQLVLLNREYYTANLPLLQKAAKSGGFVNSFPDGDGIIRRVPLIIRHHDKIYPSLALEAARLYILAQETELIIENYGAARVVEGLRLDQQIIPTDDKGQVLIPFRGPQGSFPYISATDILTNKVSPDAVKNRIIFVGGTATGLGDLHATSMQSVYAGVEVHANIAAGIINNNFSYYPAWASGAELVGTVIIGLICAIIFPYLGPGWLLASTILASTGLFQLNTLLWQKQNIILSVGIPIILIILQAVLNLAYGYLLEGRRREELKSMFGQYVPKEHVDEMLRKKGDYGFYGESREMSVLFADIRNFTTISEKLEAAKLKEMLNHFFTPMTEIIFNHQGTIDKYVGDMIMAFWGAPLTDSLHAKHAIEAAIDMQNSVNNITADFKKLYGIEVKIGIGINSGLVNVGDMGSKFRRAYTVLGDNVNLASRLEGLSKYYGVGIVVGEATRNLCIDDFVFKPLDRVKVKGKDIAVEVYEPICASSDATEVLLAELSRYQEALDYYYAQQWQPAETLLTELAYLSPEVYIYKLYLSRIAELKSSHLPADWDGVFISKTK